MAACAPGSITPITGTGTLVLNFGIATDETVLQGHNRPKWIAEQVTRPHTAIDNAMVDAKSSVVTGDTARVVVTVDAAGGSATVALALRQRIWVVASFTPLTDCQT